MKIIKYAAAKINLLLDISSRLENGYHSIYSIMQSVSLYDRISIEQNKDKIIQVSSSNPLVPSGEKNIAYKAAKLFLEHHNISEKGFDIHIDKNIPSQAGLGGGSADAAAVIVALDEMFKTKMSFKELCFLGAKVGADVPFCLFGGTMLSQNIGDVLSPLPDLPMCHIIIVKPQSSVSTAEAFLEYDNKAFLRHPNKEYALAAAVRQDLHGLCRYSSNVFEQLVEVVERVEIKSIMRSFGALYTFMTGSGSAICAIFDNEKKGEAEKCKDELLKTYEHTFLTKPVDKSVIDEKEI